MIDNGLIPIIGTGFVLVGLIGGMIINSHENRKFSTFSQSSNEGDKKDV